MSFIEQEASIKYEMINGRKTPVIIPEIEVTLTHLETGKEYLSEEEVEEDINNPTTTTTKEHIKRDVNIKIATLPLGGNSSF